MVGACTTAPYAELKEACDSLSLRGEESLGGLCPDSMRLGPTLSQLCGRGEDNSQRWTSGGHFKKGGGWCTM